MPIKVPDAFRAVAQWRAIMGIREGGCGDDCRRRTRDGEREREKKRAAQEEEKGRINNYGSTSEPLKCAQFHVYRGGFAPNLRSWPRLRLLAAVAPFCYGYRTRGKGVAKREVRRGWSYILPVTSRRGGGGGCVLGRSLERYLTTDKQLSLPFSSLRLKRPNAISIVGVYATANRRPAVSAVSRDTPERSSRDSYVISLTGGLVNGSRVGFDEQMV